jgi:hypothetical protein
MSQFGEPVQVTKETLDAVLRGALRLGHIDSLMEAEWVTDAGPDFPEWLHQINALMLKHGCYLYVSRAGNKTKLVLSYNSPF